MNALYCTDYWCIALQCSQSGWGLKKGIAGNPTVFSHHMSLCSLIHDDDAENDVDDDDNNNYKCVNCIKTL